MAACRRSRSRGRSYISCDVDLDGLARGVETTSQCPHLPRCVCSSSHFWDTESSIRSSSKARNSLHFTSQPLLPVKVTAQPLAQLQRAARAAILQPECLTQRLCRLLGGKSFHVAQHKHDSKSCAVLDGLAQISAVRTGCSSVPDRSPVAKSRARCLVGLDVLVD